MTISPSTEGVFAFDDYRIHAEKRLLLRAGEPVAIMPRAFDVLLVLVKSNGQILEKDELMSRVWPDTFVEEANLNVHVSAIRRAIGESAQHPRYIATIPGRGYRFTANVRTGDDAPAASQDAAGAVAGCSLLVTEVVRLEKAGLSHQQQATSNTFRDAPRRSRLMVSACAAVLIAGLASILAFRRAPHDTSAIRAQSTPTVHTNTAAHEYYLMGRHHWNRRSARGLRQAIRFFQKALDEDPRDPLPYVGLADAYSMLGDYTGRPSGEYRQQAIAAAMKALEIDDNLAEAHATLGLLRMRDWQWAGVESELRRAIEINPGYASAHQWYSIFLELTGRSDEAVAEAMRAQQLDPLSPIINESLGSRLCFARQDDRALAQLQKTLEIEPTFEDAHQSLALLYLHTRQFGKARAELERPGRSADPQRSATLGYLEALSGRKQEARSVLAGLENAQPSYDEPVSLAKIHAALGDRDRALTLLEQAYEQHVDHLAFISVDPSWDGLRSDPRFKAILERMGLRS